MNSNLRYINPENSINTRNCKIHISKIDHRFYTETTFGEFLSKRKNIEFFDEDFLVLNRIPLYMLKYCKYPTLSVSPQKDSEEYNCNSSKLSYFFFDNKNTEEKNDSTLVFKQTSDINSVLSPRLQKTVTPTINPFDEVFNEDLNKKTILDNIPANTLYLSTLYSSSDKHSEKINNLKVKKITRKFYPILRKQIAQVTNPLSNIDDKSNHMKSEILYGNCLMKTKLFSATEEGDQIKPELCEKVLEDPTLKDKIKLDTNEKHCENVAGVSDKTLDNEKALFLFTEDNGRKNLEIAGREAELVLVSGENDKNSGICERPVHKNELPLDISHHSTNIVDVINSIDRSGTIINKDLYITNKILENLKDKKNKEDSLKNNKKKDKYQNKDTILASSSKQFGETSKIGACETHPLEKLPLLDDTKKEIVFKLKDKLEKTDPIPSPILLNPIENSVGLMSQNNTKIESSENFTSNRIFHGAYPAPLVDITVTNLRNPPATPATKTNNLQCRGSHFNSGNENDVQVSSETSITSSKFGDKAKIQIHEVQTFKDKRLPLKFTTDTLMEMQGSSERLKAATEIVELTKTKLVLSKGKTRNEITSVGETSDKLAELISLFKHKNIGGKKEKKIPIEIIPEKEIKYSLKPPAIRDTKISAETKVPISLTKTSKVNKIGTNELIENAESIKAISSKKSAKKENNKSEKHNPSNTLKSIVAEKQMKDSQINKEEKPEDEIKVIKVRSQDLKKILNKPYDTKSVVDNSGFKDKLKKKSVGSSLKKGQIKIEGKKVKSNTTNRTEKQSSKKILDINPVVKNVKRSEKQDIMNKEVKKDFERTKKYSNTSDLTDRDLKIIEKIKKGNEGNSNVQAAKTEQLVRKKDNEKEKNLQASNKKQLEKTEIAEPNKPTSNLSAGTYEIIKIPGDKDIQEKFRNSHKRKSEIIKISGEKEISEAKEEIFSPTHPDMPNKTVIQKKKILETASKENKYFKNLNEVLLLDKKILVKHRQPFIRRKSIQSQIKPEQIDRKTLIPEELNKTSKMDEEYAKISVVGKKYNEIKDDHKGLKLVNPKNEELTSPKLKQSSEKISNISQSDIKKFSKYQKDSNLNSNELKRKDSFLSLKQEKSDSNIPKNPKEVMDKYKEEKNLTLAKTDLPPVELNKTNRSEANAKTLKEKVPISVEKKSYLNIGKQEANKISTTSKTQQPPIKVKEIINFGKEIRKEKVGISSNLDKKPSYLNVVKQEEKKVLIATKTEQPPVKENDKMHSEKVTEKIKKEAIPVWRPSSLNLDRQEEKTKLTVEQPIAKKDEKINPKKDTKIKQEVIKQQENEKPSSDVQEVGQTKIIVKNIPRPLIKRSSILSDSLKTHKIRSTVKNTQEPIPFPIDLNIDLDKLSKESIPSLAVRDAPRCCVDLDKVVEFPLTNDKKSGYELTNDGVICVDCKKDPILRRKIKTIPSVTRVLNATMTDSSRIALAKWRTKMIADLGEDGFQEFYKGQIERGTEFHDKLRKHFTGNLQDFANSSNAALRSVSSVSHLISDVGVVESHVIHQKLAYRGIIDCVAKYRNKPVLIEWKRSDKRKQIIQNTFDAPLQLCAYIGALNYDDNYKFQVDGGVVVVAYSDGTPADVFAVPNNECEKYWKQWLTRLRQYMLDTEGKL